MKSILTLVAVILILALIGWVTFTVAPDRTSISVETQKIQDDTTKLVESGKELTDNVRSAVTEEQAEDEPTTPVEDTAPSDESSTPQLDEDLGATQAETVERSNVE